MTLITTISTLFPTRRSSDLDVLKYSVEHTKELLKRELEIRLEELNNQWHYSSLERIFIENKIYRDIEEETTWEGVISAIDKGDRKSTRLNSSHVAISYAVFC